MDSQDHTKNHVASGHESHGVHLCHKCGWPFPNPHPSARHRRAHKKICGTIEGYKLLDSGETSHLALSDDDHPSDDDHKTPSPKVLERSIDEQGSDGIGERSKRSEDEVFSEAVSEFADSGSNASGSNARVEEHLARVKEPGTGVETVSGNDAASIQLEDSVASTAIVPHRSIAVDGSQKLNTEASRSDLSENAEGFRDLTSSGAIGLTETSFMNDQTKMSVHKSSNDTAASECGTNPIEFERCTRSQENKNNAGENVLETDIETAEILEKHLPEIVVSPSDNAGVPFEAVSTYGIGKDVPSDAVPAAGVIQSKGEHNNDVHSKISLDDHLAKVESVEQIKASVDGTQVNAAEGLNSANSGNSFKASSEKGEEQENVPVLSVPENTTVIENAEILVEGFKDHKAGKLPQVVNVDSFEVINKVKDSAAWDNPSSSHSCILDEGHEVSASDLQMLDDKLGQKDGMSKIVDNFPYVGEADLPKIQVATNENQRLKEFESSNAGTIEMENSCNVQTPDGSLPRDYSNELSCKSSPENATDILSDTIPPAAPMDTEGETDVHVLVEKLELKDGCGKLVEEELHSEEGAIAQIVPQIEVRINEKQRSEELEVCRNFVAVEKEKSHTVQKDGCSKLVEEELHGEEGAVAQIVPQIEVAINENQRSEELEVCRDFVAVEKEKSHTVQKDGCGKLVEEELHSEEGAVAQIVPQIEVTVDENQRSEELEVCRDLVAVEKEKSHTVQSLEKSLFHDYTNGSSLKSSLEHPMVLSDVGPVVEPMDVEVRQTNILVGMHDAGDHEKATVERCDVAADVENKNIAEERSAENVVAASAPATIVSLPEVDSMANLPGGDKDAEMEESKMKKYDISGIETREGESISRIVKENISEKFNASPDSAIDLQKSVVVSDSASDTSDRKLSESESTHLGAVVDTLEAVKEPEMSGNEIEQAGGLGRIDKAAESETGGDIVVLQNSSEDHIIKEPLLSSLDASTSIKTSATINNVHVGDVGGVTSGSKYDLLPDEGDTTIVAQKLSASATDLSVDSISRTESLEGHWGSVSVLSTQSDVPAIADAESVPSSGFQASAEAEKTMSKKSESASGGQHSGGLDMFEPPSFMTLVEPRGDQKAAAPEIQTVQNMQEQKAASLQPGWFPSLTHVVNKSPGRKKNEEIIAKVTNWSTGRQHTPLKNLLGEAHIETKSKSSNAKENPAPLIQEDENMEKDTGVLPTTVSSVIGSEMPVPEPAKKEVGKEWNSPARYPTEIKREKRKVKGRPYWAQFVCCSSVN